MVVHACEHHGMSLRQACRTFGMSTSSFRYKAKKKEGDNRILHWLFEMAEKRPSWGFWKMHKRLKLEGLRVNHKRLHRLYKLARLNIRRKSKRRLASRAKAPLLRPIRPNILWSMDFMRDTLLNGQPFRSFNVMDEYNREVLNITISKSIPSTRVIKELNELINWRGKPQAIRVDNGPEFIAEALKEWCQLQENSIELTNIEKGKPSQNGSLERLNRTFREDILSAYLFDDLDQAQRFAYQWIWMYNNDRPHQALTGLTPRQFLLKYGKLKDQSINEEFPTFQQEHDDEYEIFKPLLFAVAK